MRTPFDRAVHSSELQAKPLICLYFFSPDEVPAILQRGERVLSRDEARGYGSRGAMASSVINVTIQTPSPSAFQASRTQIAADLARAVRLGVRGM